MTVAFIGGRGVLNATVVCFTVLGDRTRTWVGLGLWVGLLLAPPVFGPLLGPCWGGDPASADGAETPRHSTASPTVAEGSGGELKRYEFAGTEMAVPIKLLFYTNSDETANTAAHTVFRRIRYLNTLLSDYHGSSEVRRLCDNAVPGRHVRVSPELFDVLRRSQEIARLSNGGFDVTAGPLIKLWRRARRREVFPPQERLEEAKRAVGFRNLVIDADHRNVTLKMTGMRIDLGGIAKGYAIDEALRVLREYRITRALVDMGGDMALGDPPPNKPGWTVGIAGFERDAPPRAILTMANTAIATSGDQLQFVEINGKRYSHLIDPRTATPLTDHSMVTVIAPTAMEADALASAVSVLGPEEGIALIDRLPGTAALIVRKPGDRIEETKSGLWDDRL